MTRREFLGTAAAAAVPLRWREARLPSADEMFSQPVLLDLGQHCSLGESLAGYAAALGAGVLRSDATSVPRSKTLIVPAAVRIPPAALDAIATCLDDGGRVILESGAGFTNETDFAAHRAVLRERFDVHVERRVDLWSNAIGSAIPYIDFTWPMRTKVRDFSRVVPIASGSGKVIAGVRGRSVAIRQCNGRGTLVVLGSPIGPSLWTGDAEAKRWLMASVGA